MKRESLKVILLISRRNHYFSKFSSVLIKYVRVLAISNNFSRFVFFFSVVDAIVLFWIKAGYFLTPLQYAAILSVVCIRLTERQNIRN